MWVEIRCSRCPHRISCPSSSSWGCELKYPFFEYWHNLNGHPLREDVSWNTIRHAIANYERCHPLREDVSWNITSLFSPHLHKVILFVRMWVEMKLSSWVSWHWLSSSSWGCELKYHVPEHTHAKHFVILFVRMWVEIYWHREDQHCTCVILFVRMWVEMQSI